MAELEEVDLSSIKTSAITRDWYYPEEELVNIPAHSKYNNPSAENENVFSEVESITSDIKNDSTGEKNSKDFKISKWCRLSNWFNKEKTFAANLKQDSNNEKEDESVESEVVGTKFLIKNSQEGDLFVSEDSCGSSRVSEDHKPECTATPLPVESKNAGDFQFSKWFKKKSRKYAASKTRYPKEEDAEWGKYEVEDTAGIFKRKCSE